MAVFISVVRRVTKGAQLSFSLNLKRDFDYVIAINVECLPTRVASPRNAPVFPCRGTRRKENHTPSSRKHRQISHPVATPVGFPLQFLCKTEAMFEKRRRDDVFPPNDTMRVSSSRDSSHSARFSSICSPCPVT